MVKSVNMVMIIGNLGNDPEVRDGKGTKIAKFSVATSEEWMNKESGKKFSRTDWHRVAVFNPQLVDIASKYLKKGSLVYIRGRLRPSSWVDDAGQKRTTVEVEMMDLKMFPRSDSFGGSEDYGSSESSYSEAKSSYSEEGSEQSSPEQNNTDIDIPF
ncbi:single-stranded DNA-binding protein [Candidatus Cytomitobacter indipagum]|uniref:Single-stranded DNA-binding protein n=1 Tax=Candidatus Cytomitobacter indipagum TaxID=2601575 RepID=A0A5C0UE43_9PROT|nr:single-stranded DNA-binding protein [Candidatus Cytomitobacter indipagum]QEK37923.1 single-stranded DNA-binding protein [Candidatus Cytomitobacter indipagum]